MTPFLSDMYPQYWTSGIGGIFMRYSYEYKKMCVEYIDMKMGRDTSNSKRKELFGI